VAACAGVYSIDIAVVPPAAPRALALECDGPWHWVGGRGRSVEPCARTREKRLLLEADGWAVVSLPYWEWPKRSEAQRAYLRLRLADAGIDV